MRRAFQALIEGARSTCQRALSSMALPQKVARPSIFLKVPQDLICSCPQKGAGWASSSQYVEGTIDGSWLFDNRSNVEAWGGEELR